MADFLLDIQGMFLAPLELFGFLPFWMKLVLLFVPAMIALVSRNPVTIASVIILDFACLVILSAGNGSRTVVPAAVLAFSASLIMALFGLQARWRLQDLTDLEARIAHIDEQMMTFLKALERRSDILDQRVEEASNAFHEARISLEEGDKSQLSSKPSVRASFTPSLRSSRPDASESGAESPTDSAGPSSPPRITTAPANPDDRATLLPGGLAAAPMRL